MKITDIIRGVLDLADMAIANQQPQEPIAVVSVEPQEPVEQDDTLLTIIKHLAGMPAEPEYANEPAEVVAPLGAAFPGGDDMHQRKDPADIRTNAPSMYPGYQAERR